MTERLSLSWCKVRLNEPGGISSHLIQYRKKSLPQVMRNSLRFNAVLVLDLGRRAFIKESR